MVRLLLCLVLTSCVPIKVSPECEERISNCLKNCKVRGGGPEMDDPGIGNDIRTECERRCHDICT